MTASPSSTSFLIRVNQSTYKCIEAAVLQDKAIPITQLSIEIPRQLPRWNCCPSIFGRPIWLISPFIRLCLLFRIIKHESTLCFVALNRRLQKNLLCSLKRPWKNFGSCDRTPFLPNPTIRGLATTKPDVFQNENQNRIKMLFIKIKPKLKIFCMDSRLARILWCIARLHGYSHELASWVPCRTDYHMKPVQHSFVYTFFIHICFIHTLI